MQEYKELCDRYSDMELSKSRLESEMALKTADLNRVGILNER